MVPKNVIQKIFVSLFRRKKGKTFSVNFFFLAWTKIEKKIILVLNTIHMKGGYGNFCIIRKYKFFFRKTEFFLRELRMLVDVNFGGMLTRVGEIN